MSQQISFENYPENAAENYERYFVPTIGMPLATELVDLAALRRGERIVDIACGTGVVTRLAAERVGGAGTVVGVDVNPGMLAVARATALANPAIDWYEASADRLPLPDEAFDVALCQLGLQFVSDRRAALQEMHRVLAPGGRLLLNVPGPTPPIFAVLEAALARHLGPEVAAFVAAVFSLYDPAEVRDLLNGAGFDEVEARRTQKTLPLPPPEDFLWQYVHSTPLAGAVAELDDDQRTALQREVVVGWQPFIDDGTLVLQQPITLATARK
jgi:ubiquinone/menaquinone biosynthesis C-methylase UbiE